MLTLEQIKTITFTRTMGGYKMSEVDDFLDQCADTVDSLLKERDAANKKLEVLADKLMEYRNDEDSIRSALVNAQRLGDTIVREANQKAALAQEDAAIKAEKLVEDARAKANDALNSVSDDIHAQQEELRRAKHEVSLFKERMLEIYKEHLSLLGMLPEEPAAPETTAEKEPSAQPAAAPVEPVTPAAPTAEAPVAAEPVEEPVSAPAEAVAPVEPAVVPLQVQVPLNALDTEADAKKAETPKSRFGDLKFGEDYDIADDRDEPSNGGKGFFKRKK